MALQGATAYAGGRIGRGALARRASVGGNFFEDLGKEIGRGLEGVTDFWGEVLKPLERNVLRPIGERLSEFEQHNREVFQKIGGIAEDIAPELILAAAGVPVTGGKTVGGKPRAPVAAGSGGGVPVWVWIGGGVALGGTILLALLMGGKG